MKRRAFVLHACQAASAAAFGSVLTGCGGSPTSPTNAPSLPVVSGTTSGNNVTITVDAASPLSPVGGAALVQAPRGVFLVTRATQDTFNATTAVCTHEGCTVANFRSPTFVCPCHGSEYNTTGNVLKGPASRPLQRFATEFSGGVVTITTTTIPN